MTNEESAKQPAVCRECQGKWAALTEWNKTGLCRVCARKVPVVAAAGGVVNGSLAERTAFACSALFALAAGWEEEIAMRHESAEEMAKAHDYAGALQSVTEANHLYRALDAIRGELWRAGLAAEANEKLCGGEPEASK